MVALAARRLIEAIRFGLKSLPQLRKSKLEVRGVHRESAPPRRMFSVRVTLFRGVHFAVRGTLNRLRLGNTRALSVLRYFVDRSCSGAALLCIQQLDNPLPQDYRWLSPSRLPLIDHGLARC